MGTTAYGNARRERNRRIRSAEISVAAAAARWVETLDAINRDGADRPSVAEFANRQQELIAATREYMAEFPVNPNYNRAAREEVA